jgi:hypothetical protein
MCSETLTLGHNGVTVPVFVALDIFANRIEYFPPLSRAARSSIVEAKAGERFFAPSTLAGQYLAVGPSGRPPFFRRPVTKTTGRRVAQDDV